MHRILMVVVLWLAGAWVNPAEAEIYKWVDEKGVTHYSNAAPPDNIAKQARHMEEYGHDPETHATRIKATEAFQESELKQFYDQKRAAAKEAETQEQQAAEMERKINFERQRLEGLIHENRSAEWNAQVKSQLQLLADDPESYFQFQLEQAGPRTTAPSDEVSQEDEGVTAGAGPDLSKLPHLVDPHTGELFPEEGGVGSRGTHYIKSGSGYLNSKTGRFFEAQ